MSDVNEQVIENKDTKREELSLSDVKQYLTAHKDKDDVKDYLNSFKESSEKESIEDWLKTDDGKKLFQSMTDKRVTESIETYKKNHFDSAVNVKVEEEIRKRYPDETVEQKRIRKIEDELEKSKREAKREKINNFALKLSQEKNLGAYRSIFNFIGENDSEEDIVNKMRTFQEDITFAATQATNKILGSHKKIDLSGDEPVRLSKEDLKHLTLDQYKEHREEVQKTLKSK